jgi:hypothetical protein
MPTTRTWTGAVDHDAANPGNWSPNGTPQRGDTLTDAMSASMLDITGDALRGDTLTASAGATFNLSHRGMLNLESHFGFPPSASQTVNVDGIGTLNVTAPFAPMGGSLQVNLSDHASLYGTFNLETFVNATVSGHGASYHNNGTDILRGASFIADTAVVGSGTFVVTDGPTRYGPRAGSLEFKGSVSSGQHVDVSGMAAGPNGVVSELRIDLPAQFHGSVVLHDYSLADLVGLPKADSWTYRNDLLSISAGGHVIDQLRVSDAATYSGSFGLAVSKTEAGDVIVKPSTDLHGSL